MQSGYAQRPAVGLDDAIASVTEEMHVSAVRR
jgi:hypothetical protein